MVPNTLSRRESLKAVSSGIGYLAFCSLANAARRSEAAHASGATGSPLAPKTPHFEPKAKRVIFLCMRGGPSHLDTFDYKPRLLRRSSQEQ